MALRGARSPAGQGDRKRWGRTARRASANGVETNTELSQLEQRLVGRLARLLRYETGVAEPSSSASYTYADIVSSSRTLVAHGALSAQLSGDRVLRRLASEPLLHLFKLANSTLPTRLMAELAALVVPAGARWLVGTTTRASGIGLPNGGSAHCEGAERPRPSEPSALICKCKLLDESGCVGVCANVCKVPTQSVLSELGMPVSMEPDLETGSCLLRFGAEPTPIEEDETLNAACYSDCTAAAISKQSHQASSNTHHGADA